MKKTTRLIKEGGGWGFMQRAVIKHIKGNDFRVYAYLITRAGKKNGRCWPSVSLIAEETGITKRNVRIHLNNLENDGWIKRYYRTNTSNMYQLYFVDTSANPLKTEAKNSDGVSKKDRGSKTDRSPVSKSDRSGVPESDRSPLSKSDSQTDQLTDHYNKPNNSVVPVPVSVVSRSKEEDKPNYNLSIEERKRFEEIWRKYRVDGESKASALSAWKKYCAYKEPDLLNRIENWLDETSGTYMTSQMKQYSEEYFLEKAEKEEHEKRKAEGKLCSF